MFAFINLLQILSRSRIASLKVYELDSIFPESENEEYLKRNLYILNLASQHC